MNLDDRDLEKTVDRINNEGSRKKVHSKRVLLHVMTEELYHIGEIIVILWQKDIQPPDMGLVICYEKD